MADDHRLASYRGKRDLTASGEPSSGSTGPGGPRFVVQRHDASSLHFDVRFEVDEVLVSWAVPKGPSTDPSPKRLARRTEDHPLDYVDFEGRIPEGYGAGTVVVWDTGSYENRTEHDGGSVPAAEAVANGHIVVDLHGEKLAGGYALTRTRQHGDREDWLMVKTRDEGADRRRNPVSARPESVLTGHTNADYEG